MAEITDEMATVVLEVWEPYFDEVAAPAPADIRHMKKALEAALPHITAQRDAELRGKIEEIGQQSRPGDGRAWGIARREAIDQVLALLTEGADDA